MINSKNQIQNFKKIRIELALLLFVAFLIFPQVIYAKSIGWVSDIHAGGAKYRNSESDTGNIQEPKKYAESLNSVLNELKKKSVDTVISSGDNANEDNSKYAKEMQKIAKKYGVKMLWVKGNHDSDAVLKKLEIYDARYYYFDYENTRIIVLDNTATYSDFYGGLTQEQIDWLKNVIVTDKNVIISMHIPIFSKSSEGHILLERYAEFENIVSSSGNVKLVLFGHYHENYEKELNGVTYKILQPMNKKGSNRFYATINLDDYSIETAIAARKSYKTKEEKEKAKPRRVKNKIEKNGSLTLVGKNFSKKSSVQIFTSKSGGSYSAPMAVETDKRGTFWIKYKVNKPAGKYCWYALDVKKNKKSKTDCYTVR